MLERYAHVREDHLRYMQKWGLIRPTRGAAGEVTYSFADLAIIRQADVELAGGASFRAVLRSLLAARSGQLAFDFRLEAQTAKVLELRRREPPPMVALFDPQAVEEASTAEQVFLEASRADDGDPGHASDALRGYQRALELDPYLVPAIINLANIHYTREQIAEALALYERAIALDPDVFEAHFNLGNALHDLGRYAEAAERYRDALERNPVYADAHFYLAVALEKDGRSQEARPHWGAYRQLAPEGEWVELAKEFSD